MVELANSAAPGRSRTDSGGPPLPPLKATAAEPWLALAERALEPNGYGLPEWALAANGSDTGGDAARALSAGTHDGSPIGLLPVISAWREFHMPLPLLLSADPYHSLGTPLLDRGYPDAAVAGLLDRARAAGARGLLLRYLPLDGAAATAFARVLAAQGLEPRRLLSYARASLDATLDADRVLRDALGPKKLKELRRLRNRLGDHGEVGFEVATLPDAVGPAFDEFLTLESSGWKGRRGSALAQLNGDAARLRVAAIAMAARRQCEIITLRVGATPVAAGIVLRHLDRAFFFKLGIDETFAKYSPGVQLTLELTRHLCADPQIALADSTAAPGHPMIDPIWRGRLAIGDLLIPLRHRDPLFAVIRLALQGRTALRGLAARLRRR